MILSTLWTKGKSKVVVNQLLQQCSVNAFSGQEIGRSYGTCALEIPSNHRVDPDSGTGLLYRPLPRSYWLKANLGIIAPFTAIAICIANLNNSEGQ
jgi:hypothetical protein